MPKLRRRLTRWEKRCVAFVVQRPETFEIVAPVVRALRNAGRIVHIVVHAEKLEEPYEGYDLPRAVALWDLLAANGFAPEPLVPVDAEAARLRDMRPQAVFLPTPYESLRHESMAPSNLRLPVHYLNYGLNVDPPTSGIGFDLPFYRECAVIYAENEYCAEQFARTGVSPERIVRSGHPSLDHWDTEWGRADVPTVLWCPHWATIWPVESEAGDTIYTRGYSTFLETRSGFLEEARSRPRVRFILRPHPLLFDQLQRDFLWTQREMQQFLDDVAELPNASLEGHSTSASGCSPFPFYPSHIRDFEQAWAMVTDGISFLAEFAYTGKPLLLTEAPGNPGWNPVGQAICRVVERSDGIEGLASFLDQVESGVDPGFTNRRRVLRELFFRPEGGSVAAIVRHLEGERPVG